MVFTALVFGDKHFNYKCNARKREGRKKLVVSHSSISIINFAKHLFVACCCVARSFFFVVVLCCYFYIVEFSI
jgi:hypothetical protein